MVKSAGPVTPIRFLAQVLNPNHNPIMKVLETPTRSQFLWLADGNVVIQAEATQYKVYRGLLTLHSAIFNDMFALPQPPLELGEQFVEGCAVVHLSDTAADVSIVLETLFLRRCDGVAAFQFTRADLIWC